MYINQCAESSSQQGPRHIRKREEKQCSSSKGVDGPESRECKEEVDKSEAPRSPQRLVGAKARIHKNRGRVECNNVDTAHLLGDHDSERGKGSAANTRDRKELDESSYIVALSDD